MTITTVQDLDSLANDTEAESTRRALHHLAIELVQRDDQVTGLRASVVELRKQLDLMRTHNQTQSVALAQSQELEKKLQAECTRLLARAQEWNVQEDKLRCAVACRNDRIAELSEDNDRLRKERDALHARNRALVQENAVPRRAHESKAKKAKK